MPRRSGVDLEMVNTILLVVILILVIYCCLRNNNEGFKDHEGKKHNNGGDGSKKNNGGVNHKYQEPNNSYGAPKHINSGPSGCESECRMIKDQDERMKCMDACYKK